MLSQKVGQVCAIKLARSQRLISNRITIGTYKRPKELNNTIKILLSEPIPSLQEIVIINNNLNDTLPEDYVSPLGVPVRHRMSEVNSMNNRLTPDPLLKTQAVFSSDDDVYFTPSDLEWGFQIWRNYGQNRIVGAHGRCVGIDESGQTWYKSKCATGGGQESYYQSKCIFPNWFSQLCTYMK